MLQHFLELPMIHKSNIANTCEGNRKNLVKVTVLSYTGKLVKRVNANKTERQTYIE